MPALRDMLWREVVMATLRPGWRQSVLAVLLLTIAHMVVLQNFLGPGIVLRTTGDPNFSLAHSFFLHQSIWAGDFPLWNPYLQFGAPEFFQFNPLVLLIHAIAPSDILAYKLYSFLPAVLVGVGAWLFLGHFVKSFPVRLLGASMTQFSAFGLQYMMNPMVLVGYAHLPFLLYLAESVYRNPSLRRNYLALFVVTAMLVLHPYPQTILFGLLATGVYFTVRVLLSENIRQFLLPWTLFMVFVLLGIGAGMTSLLLIQVVPSQINPSYLEYLQSPAYYLKGSFPSRDLLTFFAVNFYGETGYIQPFGVFNNFLPWLALGVLLYLRRLCDFRIFTVVAVLVVLAYFIAFGDNNPVYVWLIEKLPYYVRVGVPQRALLITSTLLPLLASLGFLALHRSATQSKRDMPSFAIIVGAFALTVLLSEWYSPQDTLVSVRLAVYLFYGVAVFLLAAGSWGKTIPYGHHLVLAGVAVLLLATPLAIRINHPVMRVQRDTLVLPTQWIEDNVVIDFLGPEDSYFRYTSREFIPTELHNRATLARLRPDTQLIYRRFGTASMMTNTRHQGNDFGNVIWGNELSKESGTLPLTRMSAIRWVIIDSPLPNPQLKYLGEFEDGEHTTYFYEVPNPLPRAFAPSAVAYTPDNLTLPQEPSELATIDVGGTELESLSGQEESSGHGEVEIAEYRNQKVRLTVSMEQPGWVVLSDTFYPGWTASVDGEAVDIYRANHLFRAVRVPAGEHTVVFSYFPSRLKFGLLLMALSVIGAIAVAWPLKYILSPSRAAAMPSPRRSLRSRRTSRR